MSKRILFFILFLTCSAHANESSTLKSVNFYQEGEVSKLVLDFSKPVLAERNHIKSDKQIILDIKNVKSEKKFMRGIDTSEFSGSAVFVSPYVKPGTKNDLRFAIQLRDNVRSFVEAKGNRVVLHIENRFGVFTRSKLKKISEKKYNKDYESSDKVFVPKSNSLEDILENLTQSGVKRYVGRKISLNVNNVEYKEILKMIGDTSGFNIIIEDEVGGLKPLTISLTNLPWDQVLDTIMDLGGLVAYKFGNILTITTSAKAREQKELELSAQTKNKTLEPLVTKIFPISYSELKDMSKILSAYSTKDRGNIQQDKRTQNLIVIDTVEVLERMKKIIETLDTQTPQILIESKIVEVEENYQLKAGLTDGVKIGYNALGDTVGSPSAAFALNTATSPATSLINATIQVGRLTNLAFALELMENESKGRVVTAPKVVTENNNEAKISDISVQNFVTSSRNEEGILVPIFTPIEAKIDLTVTPKVTNEGSITMKVVVNKDTIGARASANTLPAVVKRSVATNVLVENGSTVVIGGLYQNSISESETGVPFLKDLPLIGWLFKSAYNPSKTRSELIIFLTPRIINQEEAGLVNRDLGDDLGI